MSHPPPRRRTETFIVRLWAEYLEQTPPVWRGEIERVGGGRAVSFGDRGKLLALIEAWAVKPEQETPARQGGAREAGQAQFTRMNEGGT